MQPSPERFGMKVATRELTGMSKARNGDGRPFGALSCRPESACSAKPGSGDGKIVANNGQMARLWEASAYSPLNNGERQFEQEMAGSPASTVEPVSGEAVLQSASVLQYGRRLQVKFGGLPKGPKRVPVKATFPDA